jgi:hypothetical protein
MRPLYEVKLNANVGAYGRAGDSVKAPADMCRAWYQTGIIDALPEGVTVKSGWGVEVAARQTAAPPARPAIVHKAHNPPSTNPEDDGA